jgi:hypothetical protein
LGFLIAPLCHLLVATKMSSVYFIHGSGIFEQRLHYRTAVINSPITSGCMIFLNISFGATKIRSKSPATPLPATSNESE